MRKQVAIPPNQDPHAAPVEVEYHVEVGADGGEPEQTPAYAGLKHWSELPEGTDHAAHFGDWTL